VNSREGDSVDHENQDRSKKCEFSLDLRMYRWATDVVWRRILARAEVPHRPNGHCRHSFAVLALKQHKPLNWIQRQMGHNARSLEYCAIPRELFERSFLATSRGALSGAIRERSGRFQLANGSSLFLDEVGDLPPEMAAQAARHPPEWRIRAAWRRENAPRRLPHDRGQ
jgi:hypothetical protein